MTDRQRNPEHEWALVLAGGDGTRLSSLTRSRAGVVVPKQFCSLDGGPSLLRRAVARAGRIAASERIVTVVAAQHRAFWAPSLREVPRSNVVVQPRNRGTAAGVLLPLLSILDRDREARVVVLPSDHFVAREDLLARTIIEGLHDVERAPDQVVLLGIVPDTPDDEYGFILPGEGDGGRLFRVHSFVEKPDRETAAALLLRGGLWNSFVMVSTGRALLRLYETRLPRLLAALQGARCGVHAAGRLASTYRTLGSHDFSRELLQGAERTLRVMAVPPCGWTDLGTPARVTSAGRALAPPADALRPWALLPRALGAPPIPATAAALP